MALNGKVIPLTNNLVERLMGKIAKRVKHYVDALEYAWS
jgi:hypothetical protein